MYAYWFNSKSGTSNEIYSAEIISIDDEPIRGCLACYIKADSNIGRAYKGINRKKGEKLVWFKVPSNKEIIRNRTFWLENDDMNRAKQIVNDYLNNNIDRLHKKLERLMS